MDNRLNENGTGTMARVTLTDRMIQAAKATTGPQTDFFDTVVPGLSLRVSAGGRKAWCFIYTRPADAKRARITLGNYPATSLSEARAKAIEARGHENAGQDPRIMLGHSLAGAMTVGALLAAYVEKHLRPNLRSAAEVERRLNRNVTPMIGDVRLSELHKREANRVVDAVLRRGSPVEAARVFEDMRAMFRWAAARGDIDRNPMEGMRAPTASKPRERVLSDEEVRTLWVGLPKTLPKSKVVQRVIKLCLITGQRVGEVSGMARSELDLRTQLWTLPGARTKNGVPHTVPLSGVALHLINEAIKDAAAADFVFPSREGSIPPMAVAKTIARAQKPGDGNPQGRFGLSHWTAHDLRRTALTGMAKLGVAPIVLGHVANHLTTTKAGVTLAVYSKHTYDREKREALNLWADRLVAIVADEAAAEIVPLRRGTVE